MRRKDWTGHKVGRLTVIKEVGKTKNGHYRWYCECECGGNTIVLSDNIRRKHSNSCGCIRIETVVNMNYRHGMSKKRLHNTWCSMLQRCNNEADQSYIHYGGRGIKVCDRWYIFENFMNDMLEGYKDTLTLDRVDNEKGYSKDNCRWADMITQGNNKRTNKKYIVDGIEDTMANHARKYKISTSLVHARINRLKWSIEKSFKTPIRIKKHS